MSKDQRLKNQSAARGEPVIRWSGGSHTIAEACGLALKAQQSGNLRAAVDIYDLILAQVPAYAQVHDNRGNILLAMRRPAEALASFDQAIALMPGYANAHNNRGAALQQLNRHEEALASFDRAIALDPARANAHNNRGASLHQLKRHEEALASFDQAIALKPDYVNAYNNRGAALQQLNRPAKALVSFDRAIALKPDHASAHYNRGIALQKLNRFDEALASFDRAIALQPGYVHAQYNRGLVLINQGRMQEAEEMFRKALAMKPDYVEPWCALAGIRQFHDADGVEVTSMRTLLNLPDLATDDREKLYFALGKIYDDCCRYDEAFECYQQGNRLCNANVSYERDKIVTFTNDIMSVFSRDFLARPFAFASDSRSPLFIVGMPRSGTTLAASIFSNHRSIATAGELSTIQDFAVVLPALTETGIPYPLAAKQVGPDLATRLINDYEKRLRRDAGSGAPHVVDKHPLNFWHLGFITMLFPKARVIHCTRNALDTGLSNYFQRFSALYNYSFDLRNIGHYFCEYARLMEHWRQVLPLKMIEISYEDLISNTEPVVRQALDCLGLEWDERCLAPHTNPAPVVTASHWQVRQPIYRQSLERWRHYEKHLAPLQQELLLAGHLTV